MKTENQMREVDDEISQLVDKVQRQVKDRKSLIEDIELIIRNVINGDFGHITIAVETNEDGFNNIKLMTEDPLGYEEIKQIEKVICMENNWNEYCFWIPYD